MKITVELENLINYIRDKFIELGLVDKTHPNAAAEHSFTYVKAGLEPNYDKGRTVTIHICYKSNGAANNTSVYLNSMVWDRRSGYGDCTVKISIRDGKKKVDRLINEVVNTYLQNV